MSLFSKQVKELEGFFGVALTRRQGRKATLTEAGDPPFRCWGSESAPESHKLRQEGLRRFRVVRPVPCLLNAPASTGEAGRVL